MFSRLQTALVVGEEKKKFLMLGFNVLCSKHFPCARSALVIVQSQWVLHREPI
jgi:hypothetical protein